ncbi:site-specific integrase, partial [Enterococcus faecium]
VEDFLLDFWACGNAESSCRAYAFGLLRWFRHLQIAQTSWERATRTTVRDFVLACKQPSALSSRTLKPRTINHNLAVVSEFY